MVVCDCFMGILPGFAEYSGPHAVGTLTLEREISSKLQFKYSSISTLLVRLFYPCTPTTTTGGTQKREPWIHGPRDELLKGYGEFMGVRPLVARIVSKLSLVSYLTMPALSNAPFKQPLHPYPVVIFSHGLGGHRSAYSQYCGNLASYGFMVVAIEHRDNSAPVTFVRGEEERVPFVRITQTNAYTIDKRRDQLQHRAAEVQFAVDLVREMNETGRVDGLPLDFKAGSLCTEKMVCAGHSFGAATLVHALLSTDIAPAFGAAILLDPWMEPLVDYLQSRIPVPCLTILSDQFSKWVSNYSHVKTMVKSQGNALCFVVRDSLHLSQSDFHAAFPRLIKRWQGLQVSADTIMNLNVRASVEFLRQQGVDCGHVQKPDESILAGDSGIAFMEQIVIE